MTLVPCPRCGRPVAGGRFCPGCGARLDDPLTGKVLAGRVKLVAQTGSGPFFATYRAEHRSGGAVWAVKVLEPTVAGDDGRKRRFLENAGAMLALGDPRLLPVREMAEEEVADGGGRPRRVVFAVTDGPQGPSLADLVRRQGPLDTHRAAAFGRGMLEALGAVHAAGIVHGDLHPACVFLEPDGPTRERVRLADAGLAAGLAGPPGESPDPAALGSDGGRWISPEQALGHPAGKPSDLHAAGAVIYFALTGTPPWQAEKGASLLFEIQKSVPRAASDLQSRVPGALDRVLDRALAKSAPERFRTAAEFAKALADATADVAPVPRPSLPADVTPGSLTVVGTAPDPTTGEVTITAPPARRRRDYDDATIHGRAEPTGDETLIAGASALSPPPAPRDDDATIRALPPPPPPPPPKPPKPAPPPPAPAPRPPAKAKPAPAPAPETVRAKPAPAAKERGPWSVGTPVGAFSILLFLGVGALYGFVWAGRLDWDLPPWARTLTGRDAIPHVGEIQIAEQRVWPVVLNVEVPTEIAAPLEGQGEQAYWGEWRLEKDPAPPDAAPPKEGEAPPPVKVFGLGTLAGPPDTSGVIPVSLYLPDGRYRLQARLRYGVLEDNLIEVNGKSATRSMKVVRGRTQVVVRVRQETGRVTLTRALPKLEMVKTVTPETLAVVFGLDSDGRDKWLSFGDRVQVRVESPGYKDWAVDSLELRASPQVVEVDLSKDPGNRIKLCIEQIRKDGTPGPYANDADVMADPGVKVELALVFAGKEGKGAAFLRIVDDLVESMRGKELPPKGNDVVELYDEALGGSAGEAAARGDLERVRLLRRQARPALEFLPKPEADARRKAWAEREVKAWQNYPMPPVENGSAPDPERALVEGMVVEDLKLLAPDDPAARVRQDVANRILEFRAWAAWRAGNDLRPAAPGETLRTIPGPAVRPWLDLAVKAWPGIEDTLSFQRLAARLEDLSSSPRAAVVLLIGERDWGPGKVLANARLELLSRKDRLLLARGLRRWGDQRQEEGAGKESEGLWRHSWDVYQRVVARPPEGEGGEFPDTLVQAARWEAAEVARNVRDRDTAIKALDAYLEMNPEDPAARRIREAMAREVPLAPGDRMTSLGYVVVRIPGGPFVTGSDPVPAQTEERPFRDGAIVPVNQNPLREVLLDEFLIGEREVTVRIYREYLKAMGDPEQARLFRHPEEPEDMTKKKDARRPANLDKWSDDEPVRGVTWWDAWACAQFLGGRLPTEAEWEKAALWAGRRTPYPWPSILLEYRAKLGDNWRGNWPDNAVTPNPFDVAPSGVKSLLAGVAEWTMEPFVPKSAGNREGLQENLPQVPPPMRGGNIEVMCVRGGSFYHRAPGEEPGDSLADKDEPPPVPDKDGKVAPPKPTSWRGIDLMERRGVSAGRTPKWVGFRVVVGTKASEKPR